MKAKLKETGQSWSPRCSAEEKTIPAHGKGVVKTGLSISIPSGTYARVAPRSGLAVRHFIDTGAGVVDEDYRGEIGVVLFNHGDQDFQGTELATKHLALATLLNPCSWLGAVMQGDRIAQLILERIVTPEVEEVKELETTVRGAGGYGSTGVSQKL